jgi:hypothetical protein
MDQAELARRMEKARAYLRARAGGRLAREELHVLCMALCFESDLVDELLQMVSDLKIELHGQPGE